MKRSRLGRLTWVVAGFATLAAACEPDQGGGHDGLPFHDALEVVELDFQVQPRVVDDRLASRAGAWRDYDCLPGFDLDGAERVYSLELDAPGQIAAEIEPVSGGNMAVAILDARGETAHCVAADPRRAVAKDLAAGPYWIVVDAAASTEGGAAYRLSVEPEAYDQWVERRIAPGIVWSRWFGRSPARSVNVVRVASTARQAGYGVRGVYSDGRCLPVDHLGREAGAILGVNASFHDRLDAQGRAVDEAPTGESFVVARCEPSDSMFKLDGETHSHNTGIQMTLGVDGQGDFFMEEVGHNDSWEAMPTAFGGWPTLLPNAEVDAIAEVEPRTALGLTAARDLIIATIDGRTPMGDGFTLAQTRDLLEQFGAVRGLNLDGGGSTTLWIDGTTLSGIVNYPSDGWLWGTEPSHGNARRVPDGLFVFDR